MREVRERTGIRMEEGTYGWIDGGLVAICY